MKKTNLYTEEEIDKKFDKFLESFKGNSDQIKEAYEFTKKIHSGQVRASGEPYLVHPLFVAEKVAYLGLDDKAVMAALLHDVIEDCNVKKEEIEERFGSEVASIVEALTKIKTYSEDKRIDSIEGYKKILLASAKDIRVIVIKLADKLHNMRTLEPFREEKRRRTAKETREIYVPIAQKLGLYEIKWELEDLSFKYFNPTMYQYIREKVGIKREEREKKIGKVTKDIQKVLDKENVGYIKILGRPKSFFSIFKKIKGKEREVSTIYDLYAIRIITKNVPDCYHILYVIHQYFNVFPNRLKDYIANPKSNDYQSIHTVIFSDTIKTPVEIQIRTEEMHKLAEFGIAAHWRYKSLQKDRKFDKKIEWLREVLEWTKHHEDHEEFLRLLKFKFFEDEIFVFTPRNDVVTLPGDSTPVDFAYAVHTTIGNTIVRAKVNGETVALDSSLKNGDIVEIVTNKNSKPNEKWLNFVKTSKARIKIKEALNLRHYNKKKESEEETVSENALLEELEIPAGFKKVRKSGCCRIIRGEPVVGVVKKENELTAHHSECENAKYTPNKKISLSWKGREENYLTLKLVLENRIGLFMDILNKVSEMNLVAEKVNSRTIRDNQVSMEISFKNCKDPDSVIEKFRQLGSVRSMGAEVNGRVYHLPHSTS